jgi:tetratricopeptide (TPR) repeat protein
MSKPKCGICNSKRGKRKCLIQKEQLICPLCCADLRNDECEGCHYYQAAARYQVSKTNTVSPKKFMIEINEDIDDAVDAALALAEKGKTQEARRMLDNLNNKHPRNHMVLFGLGTVCALEENFEDALGFFQKAINIFPYFIEAHYNLGTAYQKKFDVRRCVESMRDVIEIGGDEALVQKARETISFLEKGVQETSGMTLDEFIAGQRLFDEAFTQMEKGQWRMAISCFEKCLEINQAFAQVHGNIGICYGQLGEKSEALAAFDRALEIDPEYEPAIVNRGFVKNLKDGESLKAEIKSVEYYREYPHRKRSYIKEVLNSAFREPNPDER